MRIRKYKEAISEAMVEAMTKDDQIFVTGHAVAYPSGIFGSTAEVAERFPDRVFDCPSMENAFAGIAVGAAAMGKRPVYVYPRADFMFLSFDNLLNLACKWRYMFGGNAGRVPIVLRAIVGKGWGQGATHSQSPHAPLAHFPGLTVVLPSTPADAKGLLLNALQADHPVVFFEHRTLFETEGEVPDTMEPIPFGKARILREGGDLTLVATSLMALEATIAADELEKQGIGVEVIDPRTIRPLDEEAILRSVAKTGHLIVADTSWELCGFSSEVAALVSEKGFHHLKAPVRRIALANCPAPVSLPLESAFYPKASTLASAALALLKKEGADVAGIDREDYFKGPY
ncbi:Alpha-ketoacid dehydrogenase subunit beta [Sulfidibacter corallicola]|uniref:Alpha-ketoacid dehydrogenase subunit beta n=1 Tax=Sulfidibacter corallicola TaxID=2818388 RepID=A0A8A4TWX6_SULCO|nr:transketolase C-terminal domain-containing protein [Sulfidibacter corallicola]QTD53472.1 alpha-ketoacid dehydrogenase subunit beta [Sulfidibacter corallicola]